MEMVRFSIPIIGSICVIVAGVLLGRTYAKNMENRYEELNDLQRCFQIMHADISYGGVSFVEVLQHVEEQCIGSYKPLFVYLQEEMNGKTKRRFIDIWVEGIETKLVDTHLVERDLYELKRAGQNVGSIDREQQLTMIQIYLHKLEYTIAELEREKDKKCKLYRMFGIMGSIFVVVILM